MCDSHITNLVFKNVAKDLHPTLFSTHFSKVRQTRLVVFPGVVRKFQCHNLSVYQARFIHGGEGIAIVAGYGSLDAHHAAEVSLEL